MKHSKNNDENCGDGIVSYIWQKRKQDLFRQLTSLSLTHSVIRYIYLNDISIVIEPDTCMVDTAKMCFHWLTMNVMSAGMTPLIDRKAMCRYVIPFVFLFIIIEN